ncbi:hypothetical protein K378_01469 [Streptomyces sp. Amel2xB2]|uniref:hypothetical protein n=1 Tax=Streptomyces sp. Amel2xB2 TaxID=1305829 RepID=UPI000DB94B96|nr:hypothetical protein [Streptomyces sp. Amel2xB2]RAJ70304.1 hypothetical protein K378_01469 [Streptomyces sp. Amel2xB2]
MSSAMVTALSALGVAIVTALGGIVVAVVGRRQPRGQSRRDDFTVVTERQDKEIARLEARIESAEVKISGQEAKISGQSAAITYLQAWTRTLVAVVRGSGQQVPQPAPVPEEARPYLYDIGV